MAGPNDLSVSLTIDTATFQKNLDDAVKSLNDFAAKVKAAGDSVQASMTNMQKGSSSLKEAFNELGTAVTALGLAKFIENTIEGGAALTRLADSTNISVEGMLEMQRALLTVGKDTSNLATSLGFLEKAAENANEGNLKLRSDFQALGISMQDLKTKNPEEVYRAVIAGLAGMESPAKRAQIAYELLGRTMKGTDFRELNSQLENNKNSMGAAAQGAISAQEAYAALGKFMGDVKNAILAFLGPIIQLVAEFIKLADMIGGAQIAAGALLVTFGALATLGIVKVVQGITLAFDALAVATGIAAGEIVAIVAAMAAGVAVGLSLVVAYEVLTGKVKSFAEGYSELGKDLAPIGDAWQRLTGMITGNTDAVAKNKAANNTPLVSGATVDPNAGAVQNLKNQFALMELTNQRARDRLTLEIGLVGASDQVRAAKLAEFDADTRHFEILAKYSGDIAKLDAEQRGNRNKDNNSQIAQLSQMVQQENARYSVMKEQNSLLVAAKDLESERLAYQKSYQDSLTIIQGLEREGNQATMTANQIKIDGINKWRDAQIKAYADLRQKEIGSNNPVSADPQFQQYSKDITKLAQDQKDAMDASIKQSESWSNAWQKSINQYVEDARNGSTEAKKLFDDATTGMEDAIVNFAKTGKLSFDTLLQNIAEDILKSQIKQLFANLFTGSVTTGGGGSNILSGLGSILGFADGGTIATNGPVMVGEQGPEIISGAAGMTVTPHNAIASGGQNPSSSTNVTYNINATDARSFQQMVAADPSFIYAVTVRGQNMVPGAGGNLR